MNRPTQDRTLDIAEHGIAAAVRALHKITLMVPCPEDREIVLPVLEAAAPYIAAAAWRAGYGQGRDDEANGLPIREGPS